VERLDQLDHDFADFNRALRAVKKESLRDSRVFKNTPVGDGIERLLAMCTQLEHQRDIYKEVLDQMEFQHTGAIGMSTLADATKIGTVAQERAAALSNTTRLGAALANIVKMGP